MQLQGFYRSALLFLLLQFLLPSADAQVQDSTTQIQIIGANSLRQKTLSDGTILQTLAGNARVRQGNTVLSGDSIVLNQATSIAEVFGNVHINDSDTVHTYAQYLRYVGNERIAYLNRNVRLTDGTGTLTTNALVYNLATGIATYTNGGKVVNGTTVLTSNDAIYYSDTKDVFFKKNVHLVDPKYDIKSDSLRYNTHFQTAQFIAPTHIISENGIIDTRSGTYNLQTGEAFFYEQTAFRDSTHSATGRTVAIDEKTGLVNIEGNGKLVDSVNQVIVLGNQIFLDRKKNSFLATRQPVMIFYKDNDSTYIAADTLFSGLRMYDSTEHQDIIVTDSSSETNSLAETDSLTLTDSVNKTPAVNLNRIPPDSIRYFLAFHNVRIFNDSLQAVSDSLYYSTLDSVFRLFKNPVFWNDSTQVSGDTMYLYTASQKPERLHVFNNSMVINKPPAPLFNQMAGRDLNAYFKNGTIDYIRMKGSPAETVFYPQDEDSIYIGMNRASGAMLDIFFVNRELNKIKFIDNVNGVLYPMNQVPSDQKYLKGFKWMENRRPRHKLQLFE